MELRSPPTISTDDSTLLRVPPDAIGRFTILSEIGRGSNGVVYAARDPVLGREVAIKAIPLTAENEFRQKIEESFIKEAQAAAGLNHPHIVTIFDAGKTDTLAYMAMERLHGRDLHEHLVVGPPLAYRQAAALIARVADALHYAHKRGLVHRDIKPSNIFLTRDLKPKILDFGVALAARSDLDPTHRRQLVGTPNYMSPEQALGKTLDARSDVFSAGSILYELVTGRRAFDGKNVEDTISAVIKCEPPPVESLRDDVPAELVHIIRRAMAKSPGDRYQTAKELRTDLATFAGAREFAGDPPMPATQIIAPLPPRKKSRRMLGVSAATAIVFAALGAWLLWPSEPPAPVERAAVAPVPPPVSPPALEAEPPVVKAATIDKPTAKPPVERKTATVVQPPAPPVDGTVSLAITPWGEVFVDGASRGVSPPLTRLKLPPGSYAIEIRNSAAPTHMARVEIRPGQNVTIQHRF